MKNAVCEAGIHKKDVSIHTLRHCFRYKQKDSNRMRTCEVSAVEFIRLFLQHVLPWGFVLRCATMAF